MNKTKVAQGKRVVAVARKKLSRIKGAIRETNGARDGSRDRSPLTQPANELEQAIQRYVDLYDFAPVAYVSIDRVGRIEEANLAATQLLDRQRRGLIGSPFAVHVAKEDADLFFNHLLRCRSSEAWAETELRLKKRNGEIIFAHLSSAPTTCTMRDGARLYQTAIIDLTERKAAEEKLSWLAAFPRDNPNPILELDLERHAIYYANPATFESFPDLQRRGLRHPFLVRVLEAANPLLEGKTKAVHTEIDVGKSGYAVTIVRIPGILRLRVYSVDITERKQVEAALHRSRKLLEKLVQQRTKALRDANIELQHEIMRCKGLEGEILAISDREQQRLGQELHDGLCQQLTAIGFMARAAALRLKNHRVADVQDLDKIAQLINKSVMEARNIARDLHKEEIDAAGFTDALHDLTQRKIWKIRCRLKIKSDVNIEDDNVASQLYRILREALLNANKHARGTDILLEVRKAKNELALSVTDNGVGFGGKTKSGRGLGFHIMQYRAQSIGARLELESPRKGGARVAVYLPQPR